MQSVSKTPVMSGFFIFVMSSSIIVLVLLLADIFTPMSLKFSADFSNYFSIPLIVAFKVTSSSTTSCCLYLLVTPSLRTNLWRWSVFQTSLIFLYTRRKTDLGIGTVKSQLRGEDESLSMS